MNGQVCPIAKMDKLLVATDGSVVWYFGTYGI